MVGAVFVALADEPVQIRVFLRDPNTPCSSGVYALSRSILAAPAGVVGRAGGLGPAFSVHGLGGPPGFPADLATHPLEGNGVIGAFVRSRRHLKLSSCWLTK